MVNLGGTFGMPTDDEEVLIEGVAEQPRPRGRRNVRARSEKGQPQQDRCANRRSSNRLISRSGWFVFR